MPGYARDPNVGAGGTSIVSYQNDAPSSPTLGQIWIDSDANNLIYVWNGTGWVPITQTVSGPALVSASSSGNAFEIRQLGSGNAFVVEDSANPDATPFVIKSSGQVLIGTTDVLPNAPAAGLNITSDGAGTPNSNINSRRYSTDASYSNIQLSKARGTIASPTIVANGDGVGSILWQAYDGVGFPIAAQILAMIDAEPGSSNVPTSLIFGTTANGSATVTERMRINSSGNVGIGTTAPSVPLDVVSDVNAIGFRVRGRSSDNVASIQFTDNASSAQSAAIQVGSNYLANIVGSTERMRIDSSGNVGIGTAPGTNGRLVVSGGKITHLSPDLGASFAFDIDNTGLAVLNSYKSTGSAFAISTTTTGGSVTERMRIDNAGLITGTGTSLGAWTTYTPTLAGTGWAIGNGTAEGKYCQVGKIVHFRASITFGSTSTYGAAAAPTITLPVTAVAGIKQNAASFGVILTDTSLSVEYSARCLAPSTSTVSLAKTGTDGVLAIVSSTVPFTWASTDVIVLSGTYEAA